MTTTNPTVTKDDGFQVYRVRNNGEWATIAIREWRTAPDPMCGGISRECGEILIHSSFGTWAYQWGNLGIPFRHFLLKANFDYVFTKFMGDDLQCFDGEARVRAVFKMILRYSRESYLTKDQARELWDEVRSVASQAECDEREFGEAMLHVRHQIDDDNPMADYFSDPMEWPRLTRDDCQAVGFWRELWPHFVNHLRTEAQPEALAA